VPECQKINKNGGLDQYGTEPFEQQQFGTADVERVKICFLPGDWELSPTVYVYENGCRIRS